MTVGQNIAFPLMVRRTPRTEIEAKVARAVDGAARWTGRPPTSLLGALDRQLREQMQYELKHPTKAPEY